MSRPRTFPSEIYLTVEQQGTNDEYFQYHLSLEDSAVLGNDVRVGRYMLHEVITIGTKVITKKSSPR